MLAAVAPFAVSVAAWLDVPLRHLGLAVAVGAVRRGRGHADERADPACAASRACSSIRSTACSPTRRRSPSASSACGRCGAPAAGPAASPSRSAWRLRALVGTVGAFQMWWGGTALPGRMLVSGLLLLALPVAWEFRARGRPPGAPGRVPAAAARRPGRRRWPCVAVRNGATLALGRDGISRFLEWLSPDWHLWAFAPDFIMQPTWLGLAQAANLAGWPSPASAWAVGLLAARGTAARGSSRTGRGLAFLRADAGALLAVLLVTIVMPPALGASLKPSPSPEDRSRIEMLESFDPHARPIGIRYDPLSLRRRRLAAAGVRRCRRGQVRGRRGSRRRCCSTRGSRCPPGATSSNSRRGRRRGRRRALRAISRCRRGGPAARWPSGTSDAPAGGRWQATFDLPVDVNFVGFRASAGLEAGGRRTAGAPDARRADARSRRGVRCAGVATLDRFVFLFHDGASYPEPDGFWVRGGSRAIVSVVSRTGRLTTKVRLRAAKRRWRTRVRFETPGQHLDDRARGRT